ncbi:MurR/RpiR family transcriptional regulator [Knoellia sp. 3-2P3]|jgi:DNA-binding MurR/RpiR family transcriptional regulator|uniref:MurR/RpiR family transcriptional regulator n=1 Tax=unclassified Knoellia TaxID=2618719 RepID=UPI0023D9F9FC|nr:MurR/RpiR family transcriptional regulator [Knoellia sp. 3-2P3]MDF2090967.1 MurR/RpiR family transcriptional regulator [Knoellia sp. 3-2P3]
MPRADSAAAAVTAAPAPLLVRLRGLRPSLSPAEDRVAEQVLADARAAAALTISELAVAAKTSETTVLRFCKRLGLPGYPQLRLALAEESAQPRVSAAKTSDISAKDSIDDIIAKVSFADASAVEETAQQLDRQALAAAAAAIAAAKRVDIYGIGASAIVGIDLQQKLHRIGAMAFAWNDPHIALTSATLLARKDVAIGISHSGTTKETIESLEAAGKRGATTIAITNFPLSRLASTADLVLTTAARETSLRSGATASRIAALTVVDCLYIAVAQRHLKRARKAVEETRDAVSGHRLL